MKKQEIELSIKNLKRTIKSNKAHNLENKKEITILKKQLEELPKFEKGKWYNQKIFSGQVGLSTLFCWSGKIKGNYGFSTRGVWSNDIHVHQDNDPISKATDKEVFEALKKEAIKRGFVEGVRFVNANPNMVYNGLVSLGGLCINEYGLFYMNEYILFDGKWAEIIEEQFKVMRYRYLINR